METFDEFFTRHRGQFDDHTPPAGHLKRFEERLKQRKRTRFMVTCISAAATIAILIGFASAIVCFSKGYNQFANTIAKWRVMSQMEMLYEIKLQQKYYEVEQMAKHHQVDMSKEVRRVKRDFRRQNIELCYDWTKAQNKNYIMDLIVQNYEHQIGVLEEIQYSVHYEQTMRQELGRIGHIAR